MAPISPAAPRFGALNLIHLATNPRLTKGLTEEATALDSVELAVELTGKHVREFRDLLPQEQQGKRPIIRFRVTPSANTDSTPWRKVLESADLRLRENPPLFAEDDPRLQVLTLARRFVDKLPVHFEIKDFLARHIAKQAKARSFCSMDVLNGRYFETRFIPAQKAKPRTKPPF